MQIKSSFLAIAINSLMIISASAAPFLLPFEARQLIVTNPGMAPDGSYADLAENFSIITGTIIIDPDAPLVFSDPSRGNYLYDGGASILVDQFSTATPDKNNDLVVTDRPDTVSSGAAQFSASSEGFQAGVDPLGFYDSIEFHFFGHTGTLFSGGSIPTSLTLSDFTSVNIALETVHFTGDTIDLDLSSFVFFRVTRLGAVSDVPVPAAFFIFLGGLVTLVVKGRSDRKLHT